MLLTWFCISISHRPLNCYISLSTSLLPPPVVQDGKAPTYWSCRVATDSLTRPHCTGWGVRTQRRTHNSTTVCQDRQKPYKPPTRIPRVRLKLFLYFFTKHAVGTSLTTRSSNFVGTDKRPNWLKASCNLTNPSQTEFPLGSAYVMIQSLKIFCARTEGK